VAQAAEFAKKGAADALERAGLVLARARDPSLARAPLAFVTFEKGRAILAKHGYGLA